MLLGCVLSLTAQESKPFFTSMPGFVTASGKWQASDKSTDAPPAKQAIEVQCRLDIKECLEATATIVYTEPQVSLRYYRIIEWNKDGIFAEDDSPICMTARLLINFQERSVRAIDMPKKGAKGLPLGDGKNACQW
jgi:hypothetical protein